MTSYTKCRKVKDSHRKYVFISDILGKNQTKQNREKGWYYQATSHKPEVGLKKHEVIQPDPT